MSRLFRRCLTHQWTISPARDAQDEESGGRRDSVFLRSPSPQTDTQLLRHAIRENPFNKVTAAGLLLPSQSLLISQRSNV